MTAADEPRDLNEYIQRALPQIDAYLTETEAPLHSRPMLAAQKFVEVFVIEVSNDTLEDMLFKEWFAIIFAHCTKWYENRYGNALHERSSGLEGVVCTLGGAYPIRVPTSFVRPAEETDHIWVVFPASCHDDEDVLIWLENAPNLEAFSNEERAAAKAEIVRVANDLRRGQNALMSAGKKEVAGTPPADVYAHIEHAARLLRAADADKRGVAVWEMSLACEKVLKFGLKQVGATVPHTHDVNVLRELWEQASGKQVPTLPYATLITGSRAIMYRYGEGPPLERAALYAQYLAALEILRDVSLNLERDYWVADARFLLKRPPWMSKV
jgi:hypothetical protein